MLPRTAIRYPAQLICGRKVTGEPAGFLTPGLHFEAALGRREGNQAATLGHDEELRTHKRVLIARNSSRQQALSLQS